ncbi:recombinase family protein, partial [Salmonella enterica subsp. enterica serovar Typhimurium]|nr:recombinase family protein [Salmonella enterica subsp. enterica serovar Typhimurium]ECF0037166.1 recombinase family protein [Salmonella enterica subsp. enterica serovar Typhimurium]ECF0038026.1 recombinase family protein [Salmonella enterica subsp. enterica serovar Typhimurium]EDA7972484.1 recombinase family protein [Salmonella enterica subsp. enterica serovar Typhimurium]EDA7972721.1 recombinase family protein [Salmonella enterica subsp. enterica serovar Typhimurium]
LGEASIYRAINSVKQSIVSPYSIDVKELRDYGKYKT